MAVMPFFTPVIGDGRTPVDTIHVEDLAAGIVRLLQSGSGSRAVLLPAGPDRLTLEELLSAYRAWFGLRPRPLLRVPVPAIALVARTEDAMRLHPVNSTALAQFRTRLTGDAQAFTEITGIRPRGLRDMLAASPADTRDLWQYAEFPTIPNILLN